MWLGDSVEAVTAPHSGRSQGGTQSTRVPTAPQAIEEPKAVCPRGSQAPTLAPPSQGSPLGPPCPTALLPPTSPPLPVLSSTTYAPTPVPFPQPALPSQPPGSQVPNPPDTLLTMLPPWNLCSHHQDPLPVHYNTVPPKASGYWKASFTIGPPTVSTRPIQQCPCHRVPLASKFLEPRGTLHLAPSPHTGHSVCVCVD